MGDETLGDCVDRDSLNGQIFESSVYITGGHHKLYTVDRLEEVPEGLDMLHVFPVKSDGRKMLVEEAPVGLFYRDHEDDRVCSN